MKDKEWLKKNLERVLYNAELSGLFSTGITSSVNIVYDDVLTLINQLEEPDEIELSEPSAWKTIAKLYHPNEVYWGNVRDSYLKSLDEPEKVVVNEVMAGHIENCKNLKLTLSDSLHLVVPGDKQKEVLFARAWLDGYSVDKEKLYRVKLLPINRGYLAQWDGTSLQTGYADEHEYHENCKTIFTEQEIKNIDERYWAFAEEITK